MLEQTPIEKYTTLSGILTGLGLFIAIMSVFVFMFKSRDKKRIDTKSTMFKIFSFFYMLGLAITIFSIIHLPWLYAETGRYIYKCELNDNVPANYIGDKFNVISVEDGVWVIEDK